MPTEQTRFPSLSQSISGHLMTGAVKAVLAFLLAWLCTLVFKLDTALGQLAVALFCSYLIAEFMSAVIERPIVKQRNRTQPGGLAYVLLPFSAALLITFVATFGITNDIAAATLLLALVAVLNAAEILLTKSWIPGLSPEEEQRMFDDFKTMSKEHFSDDIDRITSQARENTKKKYFEKKERGDSWN
ncbi:hypothetical protein [Glutamicibacter sp. M10]|uniref:hypothetical protein n=1 Tax=Glutamicibacter sp. M10 TaxID=3023076 RepID=UPI0021C56E46|nr:hypothetical protein [Glutamicibacter sp. M10]UXN33383.1 hypothetical protein N6V40_08370 [Glutamicibacter sp. M10]